MKTIYVIVIKKNNFHARNLKLSMSLINGDCLFFSVYLSPPCCCQYRFKRYIAKQMNAKTDETIVMSASFPNNLSVFFPFLFRCGKQQITCFFHSFFLSLIFFFKDYNKNVRYLTIRSFFLFSFFFLSFFLSFFNLIFL